MSNSNGMAAAWQAARRVLAVVVVGLVFTAVLEEAETLAHIQSDFLHLIVVPIAFLASFVLVHGFKVFERFGW